VKKIVLYVFLAALLLPLFPAAVSAEETDTETNYAMTFSVSRCSSSEDVDSSIFMNTDAGYDLLFAQVLYDAFLNNSVVVVSISNDFFFGYYWDDIGRLRYGNFYNPYGSVNASYFGVYPFSSLSLYSEGPGSLAGQYVFFSRAHAEAWSGFLTGECYAFCWGVNPSGDLFYLYKKLSTDATWFSTSTVYGYRLTPRIYTYYISGVDKRFYHPISVDDITFFSADVSTGEAEETTIAPPVVTSDFGGTMQYLRVGATEPVLTVTAAASNGGTLSYQWHMMDCLNNISASPADWTDTSITVPTDTEGMYMYWCTVTETLSNGKTASAISSTFCVQFSDIGNSEVSNWSWYILDGNTLVITGEGATTDFASSSDVPWYSLGSQITSVVVCDGITKIGKYSFRNCSYLVSLDLPDTLLTLGNSAIYVTSKDFTDFHLPCNVVYLDDYSVKLSYVLSIDIPESVSYIGTRAFNYCSKLKTVFCYNSVPPLAGSEIFYSCTTLDAIYVPTGSAEAYKVADGWSTYADIIFEFDPETDYLENIDGKLDEIGGAVDDLVNGDHGFDSSGSDFSSAGDDLANSSAQMSDAMSGGMDYLSGMVTSTAFLTTVNTLDSAFDAVFEGHEVTICGITANPFVLLVSIGAVAILIPLALKYVFRKRGGG